MKILINNGLLHKLQSEELPKYNKNALTLDMLKNAMQEFFYNRKQPQHKITFLEVAKDKQEAKDKILKQLEI